MHQFKLLVVSQLASLSAAIVGLLLSTSAKGKLPQYSWGDGWGLVGPLKTDFLLFDICLEPQPALLSSRCSKEVCCCLMEQ